MKSKATKTGVTVFLAITLALCAAISVPVSANAASSSITFDVIQQANGAVYAAPNYCDTGMKEVKDAYSFCVVGDQVYYFADWEADMPYAASLYVSKLDGSGKKLLANYLNGCACYLDGKIYYDGAANENGKSEGLYCLDVKTGKAKRLVAGASLITIYDSTIYYRDGKRRVYACTLTGGKKKRITDMGPTEYGVVADGNFFTKADDDNVILALDVKAPLRYYRVALADEYSYFMVDAGWVYYVRDKALYKCETTAIIDDGDGEIRLCSVSSDAYGVYPVKVVGKTLYFLEEKEAASGNMHLYKVPVSGGLRTFTGNSWVAS